MRRVSIGILSLLIVLSGCVSDQENFQIIFERDVERIEQYIAENSIPSVKEFNDPALGIWIFWQETSGSGIKPELGDTLTVNYTGKLLNNSVFDTSHEGVARENNIFDPNRTYEPIQFVSGYSQVIAGFEFALFQMEKGDKATVLFPSLYGYGPAQQPGIPSNSPLIFELELVKINGLQEEDVIDE